MGGQIFYTKKPKWTILINADGIKDVEEAKFKILNRQDNLFGSDCVILEIESLITGQAGEDYTAEDVLIDTGALAVHQEFTNAVVLTPDTLDEISDELYTWNEAGKIFIGDMLTTLERVKFLIEDLEEKYKTNITLKDLKVTLEKDGEEKLLSDHTNELFSNDIYAVIYNNDKTFPWWGKTINNKGLFLLVLTGEDDDEEIGKYINPYYYEDVYGKGYDWYD